MFFFTWICVNHSLWTWGVKLIYFCNIFFNTWNPASGCKRFESGEKHNFFVYLHTVFLITSRLSLHDLLMTDLRHQDVLLEVECDFSLLPYYFLFIKSFWVKQLKVCINMCKVNFHSFIVLKCIFLTFFPVFFVLFCLLVLHCEGESRQWRHVRRSFSLASTWF